MTQETVTKESISRVISETSGLTMQQSYKLLKSILGLMETGITKEHNLKLSNFGSFEVRHKTSRIGRNPKTREDKVICARKTVSFKASDRLKDKILNEKLPLKTETKVIE